MAISIMEPLMPTRWLLINLVAGMIQNCNGISQRDFKNQSQDTLGIINSFNNNFSEMNIFIVNTILFNCTFLINFHKLFSFNFN